MPASLAELQDFASRYTAAWCSGDAASVAAFFCSDGWLRVNDDPAAVGRAAITGVAQGFMSAFPDLQVAMNELVPSGEEAEYRWTLRGTNTGPGGTGRRVCISGFEKWRMGGDGLIAASEGSFDVGEYRRQLEVGRG